MNQVGLPIIDDSTCQSHWTDFLPNTELCAGYENGGKDFCSVNYLQIRGLFDMYCVLYDISKEFDSNSQMGITSLQSILRDLKYTISISESISEMRHGTLI